MPTPTGQLGDLENARTATAKLLELYPGFDLEKAAMEHKKFSFEQSYIDLAVDGLRKAGVPAKSPGPRRNSKFTLSGRPANFP